MKYFERYADNPHKDEDLNDEDRKEYELLRNLYYYLMAHGEIDETFPMWIHKNKENIEEVMSHAKKLHAGNSFEKYMTAAREA